MTVVCVSCAMPMGFLPVDSRAHSQFDREVKIIHVRDSAFSDSFNTWSVDKVVNNSPFPFEGYLVCKFTVPRHDTPTYAYHRVELQGFQWKEYYSSTDMKSRFRMGYSCKLEKD